MPIKSRMRMLRRLLTSIAGGLLLPFGLFWFLNYGAMLLSDAGHERSGTILVLVFLWPLLLADWIFPRPPSCPSCGPSDAALVTAIIIYFIFYSALTYVIQIVAAKL